jgi:branched-chain amino acid transport system substrate-binding protein
VNKALIALAAVLASLAVSIPGAFGRTLESAAPTAAPGVTSSAVTIGGTFPLTGAASLYGAIGRGMEAYFKYRNAIKGPDGKKGVRGRQIVWKYYDDGYNPAQTVQLTNKLILEDKVFAVVGSVGTEHNPAVRPLLNDRKIPQLLVSTGASYWGLQYKQFPWTVGWQPDYIAEGRAYGEWIKKNAPNAKIAIFYQNDDYGKDYLRGVKIGLGAKKSLIVSEQSYEITDTSYGSQLARQKASGAIDSVMAAASASAGAEFVDGAVSSTYLKNNANPKYLNDPIVKQYTNILATYGPSGANPKNTYFFYGVAKAYDVYKLLYSAGKNPTRAALLEATRHMNWVSPYMLKGVKTKTSKTDRFPLSQVKLTRYSSGTFNEFGPLIKGR